MERTTIKDVAKASGCSIATVSLALSDKPSRVSNATRKKIRKIAKELNYSPNQIAVSLKTKKSKMIGIVMADMRNPHVASVFMIIDKELRKNGYSLICCTTSTNDYLDIQRLNDLIACGIEGIIFSNPSIYCLGERWNDVENAIASSGLPIVGRDNPDFCRKGIGSSVSVNYEEGAYLAIKHLLELGHTKIGCITGPMDMTVTQYRLDGYKRALRDHAMDFDAKLIYEGDYEIESGYAALPYLLGQNVTAVFSFNDNMAFGLFRSARSFGIKIPHDLSVVGFDDVSFDEVLEIPLTSVNIHAQEIGTSMAGEIIRLLQNRDTDYKNIIYEPHLMVRGSTRRKENING